MNAHVQRPPGARAEWIDCSFDIEGQHVAVSVRRLDDDERQRMAAQIAWFAEGLITPGIELDATGWPALLENILSSDVAITLREDRSKDTRGFWNQLVCLTLEAFVTANRLRPLLDLPIKAALIQI